MYQSESDEEELLLLLLLLLEKPFNLNFGFLCFTFTPKGPTLICTNNKVNNNYNNGNKFRQQVTADNKH